MNSLPDKHHRHSIRLRGYDYSQNSAYFVTLCAERRLCLFGDIENGGMRCNVAGEMLSQQWLAISERFPQVILDEWIVMPNHFHGIVILDNSNRKIADRATTRVDGTHDADVGATIVVAPNTVAQNAATLGDIVGAFKSLTTNAYIAGVGHCNWPPFPKRLWQRNYYEHIIRSERSLNAIREYIALNPTHWAEDDENPEHKSRPTSHHPWAQHESGNQNG